MALMLGFGKAEDWQGGRGGAKLLTSWQSASTRKRREGLREGTWDKTQLQGCPQ